MVDELSDGTVRLRAVTEDDLPRITELLQDPLIAHFTASIPLPYTLADAYEWRRRLEVRNERVWAVEPVESGELAGIIGLMRGSGEIGYWLGEPYRGRGLASRAVRLVADHGLASGHDHITISCDVINKLSQRVAERAGFVREGDVLPGHVTNRVGRQMDVVVYRRSLAHVRSEE